MTEKAVRTWPAMATAAFCAIIALAALGYWMHRPAAQDFAVRVDGGDGRPKTEEASTKAVNLEGTFKQGEGTPGTAPGAWPCFRGRDRDNIAKDTPPLAEAWPEAGPPVLWRATLGEGYAGPVAVEGRVYVLDYDEAAKADAVRCFSLDDGREIWRRTYGLPVKRNHGMSRTVPAVADGNVVALGPRCLVVCLDAATGAFRWGKDLERDYGTEEPLWYAGQCPHIENGRAIIAPCGRDVLMTALDLVTGAPVWTAPNPKHWNMSHSSIAPMDFGGRRMYVYCALGGVAGIAADGPDAGAVLWETPWEAQVIAPSPVPLPDGQVFVSAGYGVGGMMLQVRTANNAFTAEVVYKHDAKGGLASEQQTPIFSNGLLYGILPKDGGALRNQFVCYRPDNTLAWSSGQENRFGLGPYILADGKFYVLDDNGTLTMLRASAERYEVLGQAKLLGGREAWGPIAVVGSRMLLRDEHEMICIEAGK